LIRFSEDRFGTKKPPTLAWTVEANAGAAFAYRMTTTERCTDMRRPGSQQITTMSNDIAVPGSANLHFGEITAVALMLLMAICVAVAIPARRAMSIEPVLALKT